MFISVIIPTYNPNQQRLEQTLKALKVQSLPFDNWELIIVDNNSSNSFQDQLDLSWHPAAKIVSETRQGLTYARVKGFEVSIGDIIIMVDDDNILDENYLKNAAAIFIANQKLGSIGGKSIPKFESEPPHWLSEFYGCLALRDLGDKSIISNWRQQYPDAAPIGAGMAIRKEALQSYIKAINSSNKIITDRTATSLASGGDNEINLEILKSGWLAGYFPELTLQHIIPVERMQPKYLAKLIHNTNKSWVMLLKKHHISSWKSISKKTLILRKCKTYFTCLAWKSDANYIKWMATCGTFDGLAENSY